MRGSWNPKEDEEVARASDGDLPLAAGKELALAREPSMHGRWNPEASRASDRDWPLAANNVLVLAWPRSMQHGNEGDKPLAISNDLPWAPSMRASCNPEEASLVGNVIDHVSEVDLPLSQALALTLSSPASSTNPQDDPALERPCHPDCACGRFFAATSPGVLLAAEARKLTHVLPHGPTKACGTEKLRGLERIQPHTRDQSL